MKQPARPGLAEVTGVWAAVAAVGLATVVTYGRLEPAELYHVSESGLAGGLGRALVYVNFPVALIALALLPVVLDRLLAGADERAVRGVAAAALVAVALCLGVAVPGVVDQADLDAKPVNALPALGVGIVAALTVLAARRGGIGPWRPFERGDRIRLAAATAIALVSLPWMWAEVGFYVSDTPLLGDVFLAEERRAEPGDPGLRAVHLGRHHGTDGVLLALVALALSRVVSDLRRPGLRRALALVVSALLVYGILNAAQDFWLEQVVKRGTTDVRLPSFLRPGITWAWAFLLTATAAVYALLGRRLQRVR